VDFFKVDASVEPAAAFILLCLRFRILAASSAFALAAADCPTRCAFAKRAALASSALCSAKVLGCDAEYPILANIFALLSGPLTALGAAEGAAAGGAGAGAAAVAAVRGACAPNPTRLEVDRNP
jgi:O-antigen ligase